MPIWEEFNLRENVDLIKEGLELGSLMKILP